MTDKEILQKAIIKSRIVDTEIDQNSFDFLMNCERAEDKSLIDYYFKTEQYYPIIFSHDFAKAFWGEKKVIGYAEFGRLIYDKPKDWKYHLQQMILEPEPLKYLEKFLLET